MTLIQEGVDYAKSGDTLIIQQGVYNESVEIFNKELNLIGTDKNLCVIQFNNSYYWKVPLVIVAENVENLTIYGTESGKKPPILSLEEIFKRYYDIDTWERINQYSGYAIHIEQNFLYGRELKFKNCRIIFENNACVGIGGRGNCSLVFENCELISAGNSHCIYLHDSAVEGLGGDIQFILKDCSMVCFNNPYVLYFHALLPENIFFLTFQGVGIDGTYNDIYIYNEYEQETGSGWYGLNNAYLTPDSYGNTLSIMNAIAANEE